MTDVFVCVVGYKHIHVLLLSPGLVQTDIAKHAIGGPVEMDFSSGQSVEELADVVGSMVARPDSSADVYSRDIYKGLVLNYLGADDIRSVERQPPFAVAAN